jgi:hypothetical protein
MLSLEDCIALSGLTEDEILVIVQHQHIPEIAAAELGNYLVQRPDGEACIRRMILDDIAAAPPERALALKLVLRNFVLQHPRCDQRRREALHIPERRRTP